MNFKQGAVPLKQRFASALNSQRGAMQRRRMWEGGEVRDENGLDKADSPSVVRPNNTAGEPDTLGKETEMDPEMEGGWGAIEHAPGGRVTHGNRETLSGDDNYRNNDTERMSEGGRVGESERGSTEQYTPKNSQSTKGGAGSYRSQYGTTDGDDRTGNQERPDLSHDLGRYEMAYSGHASATDVAPPHQEQMSTFGDDSPSREGDDMVDMAREIRKKRRFSY